MFFTIIIAIAALVIIAASVYFLLRHREPDSELAPESSSVSEPTQSSPKFKDRLNKARTTLAGHLSSVFGSGDVNEETWQRLQEALIRADVGVSTSQEIIEAVRHVAKDNQVVEAAEIVDLVKTEIVARLEGYDRTLHTLAKTASATDQESAASSPSVWLFVGVNGVGKTTTIGKLAHREALAGRSVILAAGDTFRAAATEQLALWSARSGVDIVKGANGADPSSVVFDAIEHAAARSVPLVMADTAGRLQTKTNLMEELRKVRRVADKGAGTVTETLLVIDATTGQNALSQAREFSEAVDVSGVVLTKLDGSAKGGIVIAIQAEIGVPVKLVGLGEGVADLVEFNPQEFVDALFG